jgi:hypothetical protein
VSLRFSAILTSKGIALLWAQLGAAPFFCHPLPATWSVTGLSRTSMPAAGALTKLISLRRCHTCLVCASALLNTTPYVDFVAKCQAMRYIVPVIRS